MTLVSCDWNFFEIYSAAKLGMVLTGKQRTLLLYFAAFIQIKRF